ncbi:zinc ribbon domain-containing protein [Aetokthonos hydrillicola]|uniref:zinc ribbon domain-containing protein n=1 Tax=Aetokthonos hydrillicola TaxID=1550245 RepID=UPI003B75C0B9
MLHYAVTANYEDGDRYERYQELKGSFCVHGKSRKVLIKVNPKHTSQKCNVCGHVDAESRDKEKFICVSCNHMAQADINAAKNIKELAMLSIASMVLGDSQELEPRGLLRPKQRKETSVRRQGKRTEPGNLSNKDIERLVS